MLKDGQVVLFRFPHSDKTVGKLRPALIVRKLPGPYSDWLICMISSNFSQKLPEFDETITENNQDFKKSGLKQDSVIRITRIAVVEESILLGSIGEISPSRLVRIKKKLSEWLVSD